MNDMTGTGHFDEDDAIELAHGLHPPGRERLMLEHARACATCEERLRTAGADRERFRARRERTLGAERAAGPRPFRVPRWWMAAAAAVAIVTTFAWLRAPAPAPGRVLVLPASPEFVRLRRAGDQDDLARLEQALRMYGSEDYPGAARMLEQPMGSERFEPLRQLYLASALLAVGNEDRARAILDPLGTKPLPAGYAEWRDWARFRTSPDPGDDARADSVLMSLSRNPGPLQASAQAALEPHR